MTLCHNQSNARSGPESFTACLAGESHYHHLHQSGSVEIKHIQHVYTSITVYCEFHSPHGLTLERSVAYTINFGRLFHWRANLTMHESAMHKRKAGSLKV